MPTHNSQPYTSLAALVAAMPSERKVDGAPLLPTPGEKVVILDDDPTGTQTVHDIPILTEWSVTTLRNELTNDFPAFYILTNSRSMPQQQAYNLTFEVARNLRAAAHAANRRFTVISRSDSTLRGHFPAEVDALAAGLGVHFDATLLIPFFAEGGRYTAGDVHYVAEGDRLVPAAQTPFAQDAAFGYHSSNLREWVEEKTEGRIPAEDVGSIPLETIRLGGVPAVMEIVHSLPHGAVCVVNALSPADLRVVVEALRIAETQGRQYLYRTAASFVPLRAGISPRALLTATDLQLPGKRSGALIVAGSYVPKTSLQLAALLKAKLVTPVEISVPALLDPDAVEQVIAQTTTAVNRLLAAGNDTLLMTSRALVTGADAVESLKIGQHVSAVLVSVVRSLGVRPRFLVAKGGITSSDLATQALAVRRSIVRGQVLPGVPVWQLGAESRYPGLIYIVFPGNVGGANALTELMLALP